VDDVFHVPAEFLEKQLISIFNDEVPHAMKSGMVATTEMMEVLGDVVKNHDIPFVIDPVMIATSGASLADSKSLDYLRNHRLPSAVNVTPNVHEAEEISEMKIYDESDVKRAAKIFIEEIGCRSVIIKGGHLDGDAADYLFTRDNELVLSELRVETDQTHGTG